MSIDYVLWQGRAWLAPIWERLGSNARVPTRLIAPKFAVGIPPISCPRALQIFHEMPLSNAVVINGAIPDALSDVIEVIESPGVFVRSNGGEA